MLISAVFFEGDNLILEKEITYSTDFGDVVVNLKEQMDKLFLIFQPHHFIYIHFLYHKHIYS